MLYEVITVIEYKFEGFEMFEEMIKNIQQDSVKMILHVRIDREHSAPKRERNNFV